jgi:hypothetical protein
VDDQVRAKNWDDWLEFCTDARRNPHLIDSTKSIQQQLLVAFAARVRRGHYRQGNTVQAQTPKTALRQVAQTLVLAGYPDPQRSYGAHKLDLPLSKLLHSYKLDDPAPKAQLTLPVRAIQCEYTMSTSCTKKQTVQFRRQDVQFFKNGSILPHSSTLNTLREADAAQLYLDNQKNGQRGATMHHTARPSSFCPVKALANWIHHLYQIAPASRELPISLVNVGTHVTSSHIMLAVRESVVLSRLLNLGYSLSRVSAHSLQASGAMALPLDNVCKDLIKKLGRWLSST